MDSDGLSVKGMLSFMGNVATGSFGSLFSSTYAADDTAQYSECSSSIIPSYVAANLFCAVDYGSTTQALNLDPEDVAQYMVDNGYVDPTTGEPVAGDYQDWLNNCSDGDASSLPTCASGGSNVAYFSDYTIDQRIMTTMDDDSDTTLGSSSSDSDTSAFTLNTLLGAFL